MQAGANLDTTAQIATMVGLALYNFNSDSENEGMEYVCLIVISVLPSMSGTIMKIRDTDHFFVSYPVLMSMTFGISFYISIYVNAIRHCSYQNKIIIIIVIILH